MNINDFVSKIGNEMDLNVNDPLSVSKKIPHYHSLLIKEIYKCTLKETQLESQLSEKMGKRLKYYLEEYGYTISNKDDRKMYIKSEEEIRNIESKLSSIRAIIATLEGMIKLLSETKSNIRNIIELEKIKKGII